MDFYYCIVFFFVFTNSLTFTYQEDVSPFNATRNDSLSMSFSLSSTPLAGNFTSQYLSSLVTSSSSIYNYKSSFKYTMALIVSLPIGTPPQMQQMVLDTGSQLSWIKCRKNTPPTMSFDPSLSSSFSILPCTHPLCKPRIPDFTLPTDCDRNRLCHYSLFYADGTFAEGNLVRENFSFSSCPTLILGCVSVTEDPDTEGILGMNRGRLSFPSQYKLPKFSYCVPLRQNRFKTKPTGRFYLGENPNSKNFQYVAVLTYKESHRMPNFDPLAYTVGISGIRIGGKRLNIPPSVFRPDAGGSGQTMIDSGTEYTFLVDAAYDKVKEEVMRLARTKIKRGYIYQGAFDMCFLGSSNVIGSLIGDMVFEFDKGVEVLIPKDRILDDVGGGISCVGIGRSHLLSVSSNIIGNFHQQNLWVEFDLKNQRVGFGKAECSRSM